MTSNSVVYVIPYISTITMSSTLAAQHVVVDTLAGVTTLLTTVQAQSTDSYLNTVVNCLRLVLVKLCINLCHKHVCMFCLTPKLTRICEVYQVLNQDNIDTRIEVKLSIEVLISQDA